MSVSVYDSRSPRYYSKIHYGSFYPKRKKKMNRVEKVDCFSGSTKTKCSSIAHSRLADDEREKIALKTIRTMLSEHKYSIFWCAVDVIQLRFGYIFSCIMCMRTHFQSSIVVRKRHTHTIPRDTKRFCRCVYEGFLFYHCGCCFWCNFVLVFKHDRTELKVNFMQKKLVFFSCLT